MDTRKEKTETQKIEKKSKTSKITLGVFLLVIPVLVTFMIGKVFGASIQKTSPVLADNLGWIAILGVPTSFVVGIALIVLGISEKIDAPAEKEEVKQAEEAMVPTQDVQTTQQNTISTAVPPKEKSGPIAVANVALIFRTLMSLSTYSSMAFGSGPWTEGRVFGYFTGFINVFWIVGCVVIILSSNRRASKGQLITVMSLLAVVVLLTVLILSYHP